MMNCFGEAVHVSTHMVPSYEGYVACCLNGTAWGLVPSVAAVSQIEDGRLVELTAPGNSVRVSPPLAGQHPIERNPAKTGRTRAGRR